MLQYEGWRSWTKPVCRLVPCFTPFTQDVYVSISCSVRLLDCSPMDCSPPGSCVHGILQARILEWVAIPSSKGSSRPRDWTSVACITGRFSTIWVTRESPGCFCSQLTDQKTFQKHEHPLLPFLNSKSGSWACLRCTPLLSYFWHSSPVLLPSPGVVVSCLLTLTIISMVLGNLLTRLG